jgi:hypothetical protein
MADDTFGPGIAETTVAYDDRRLDPSYATEDRTEPAPVWPQSQYLRELIERAEPKPAGPDLRLLEGAIRRQLRTVGLFREIVALRPNDPKKKLADPMTKTASLFVILFPGEGRDKTGVKDLNDKVLGYDLTNKFIAARHEEIEKVFPPPPAPLAGPRFTTLGQDYKTATIFAVGKKPEEFTTSLVQLDQGLRARLLDVLIEAEKTVTDEKKLKEIRTLKRTLERNKKYRFDFLFGAGTLDMRGHEMDLVFRLLTETLKGAGMGRFAAKAAELSRFVREVGQGRGVDKPAKGHDGRGRVFDIDIYLKVARAARDIKEMILAPVRKNLTADFQSTYVNGVWTYALLVYKRLFWTNPEVIRDVRKKLLAEPPRQDGSKAYLGVQRQLLELLLVTFNLIDLIKDFVTVEFYEYHWTYHVDCLEALEQLGRLRTRNDPPRPGDPPKDPNETVDWPRLTRLLTRDFRPRREPFIVHSRASEYQFFSYSSDHRDRVFFSMDIRDLGVDLMSLYETSTKVIDDFKYGELDLMFQTFLSSDQIVERKRFTYDSVVAVFREFHGRLSAIRDAQTTTERAFGCPVTPLGLPDFESSVKVMLGGDEIFVAAHPLFAAVEHEIIAKLARILFAGEPLNMRTAVAYSAAPLLPPGRPTRPTVGPRISPEQRRENQLAHDEAMALAGDATGLLKPLERTHRRIERLIDMLEANDKKAKKGPAHRKSLESLRVPQLYARVKRGEARRLPDSVYRLLRRLLSAEDLRRALETKVVELVDLGGTVVDGVKLEAQLEELRKQVRQDVGWDNYHVDVVLLTKEPTLPKWLVEFVNKWMKIYYPDKPTPPSDPRIRRQPPAAPPPVQTALVGGGRPTVG